MTTSPEYIDYDAILQGLNVGFQRRYDYLQQQGNFPPAQALRELRTVGITTPRQCGKTTWMMQRVQQDPDSFAIVMNLLLRDQLLDKYPDVDPARILTILDAAHIHEKMQANEPVDWTWRSTVYVDGNSHLLIHGRLKEFYAWLALNPNWESTTIIRLT